MKFKIRDTNEYCIIDILEKNISGAMLPDIQKICDNTAKNNKRAALNLHIVSNISSDFFDLLKCAGKKIALFNMPLNIYLLLIIMNYDKCADLFASEYDFIINKRNIVNRNFKLKSFA